jgi:hypothetical protein
MILSIHRFLNRASRSVRSPLRAAVAHSIDVPGDSYDIVAM